jgi:hypothetical protein
VINMTKHNVYKAGAALFAVTFAVLLSGTYTDPTGGAFEAALGTVSDFIQQTAAGPLFVLAGVVLAIGVGLHWIKSKGNKAAA